MAFISEIHYVTTYNPTVPGNTATDTHSTEYIEVALTPEESLNPANFTVSLYRTNGALFRELTLSDPSITVTTDPESGLIVYRIDQGMAGPNPANNYTGTEAAAVALSQGNATAGYNTLNFYDVGNARDPAPVTAVGGAAAGKTATFVFGGSPSTTIQFDHQGNQVDGLAATPDSVPCFARGTQIQVESGEKAIEALKVGDLVLTEIHGPKPIRWIGSRKLSAEALATHPNLRPIRIKAGALGANMPATDLVVSPQHRILVRSAIAQRMFGTEQVLVAAKQLLEIDGISIAEDLAEVEYFHLMFDQHEIIVSNGAKTESMYAGKQALLSVGEAAREEIFTIFPQLRDYPEGVASAAMLVPGRQARQLAMRHKKNMRPLVAE